MRLQTHFDEELGIASYLRQIRLVIFEARCVAIMQKPICATEQRRLAVTGEIIHGTSHKKWKS